MVKPSALIGDQAIINCRACLPSEWSNIRGLQNLQANAAHDPKRTFSDVRVVCKAKIRLASEAG